MAVDTRQKRFSILTLGNNIQPIILTPDGTIGQGDRQHLLWGYSGILWTSGAATGKVCVTITGTSASITSIGTAAGISTVGTGAEITITGDGC